MSLNVAVRVFDTSFLQGGYNWADVGRDKKINPASGFGPMFGPLGPTAGAGSRGTGSGSKSSAGCTNNQPRRPILSPIRGYFVFLGPTALGGYKCPRSETGSELNPGGLPPPRPPGLRDCRSPPPPHLREGLGGRQPPNPGGLEGGSSPEDSAPNGWFTVVV
jgi:hypothetical protein